MNEVVYTGIVDYINSSIGTQDHEIDSMFYDDIAIIKAELEERNRCKNDD